MLFKSKKSQKAERGAFPAERSVFRLAPGYGSFEGEFYEALRAEVPILDACFGKIERLTNDFRLISGEKQAQAIIAYSLAHSLGALPGDLQEIGRLRMLHPEASLEELGQMLKKPVGKSGANHKMRRLMALIQENQRQDGDGRDDQANAEPGGDHAPEQIAD